MPTHAGRHVPPGRRFEPRRFPPRLKSEDPPFTPHLQRGSHATVKVHGSRMFIHTQQESEAQHLYTRLKSPTQKPGEIVNSDQPGQSFGDMLRSRRINWILIDFHQLHLNSKPASPHKEASEPFLNNAQESSDQLDCYHELLLKHNFKKYMPPVAEPTMRDSARIS